MHPTPAAVLLESFSEGVLTLTMNRPETRNAVNPEMCALMVQALQRAAADRAVRAIVLTGAGQAFCSGGDVKSMAADGSAETPEQKVRSLRGRMEAARLLHRIAKPTVAVVRGAAAGAGLSLAMACDLRIVAASSKFTTAFGNVGLSGDYGGSYFLTQLVGTAKARELYFLAPVLKAPEALALGIVNRVVEDDALDAEVQAVLTRLANGPAVSLGHMKDNLNLALRGDLEAVLESEALRHTYCLATEDHKEAARAFVEKRVPKFVGA